MKSLVLGSVLQALPLELPDYITDRVDGMKAGFSLMLSAPWAAVMIMEVNSMLISKFANGAVDNKVEEMEREYNISLPGQYKEFLCKYNGGYTPKTKFKVGKISSDIRGFYGVGNVKLSFNKIELRDWMDKGLLPIATDSFGNYLIIGLDNDSNGKIFFCNHEAGNKIVNVAENIKVFFKYCKSEKISEASRLSIKEREEALIARGRGSIITDDLRRMWQVEIDKYENMIQEEVVVN